MTDSIRPQPPANRLVDIGTGIGCGLLAAFLGSGPAALRLTDAGGERVWIALAATATPFTVVAVVILREAYAGLRSWMGERRGFFRVFVTLWLGSIVPVLYVLGAVLRTHTHHRPLAGATFALVGALMLVACGAFARRLAAFVEMLRASGHSGVSAVLSTGAYVIAFGALLFAAHKLHARLPAESAATMVDTTALALASALAARPELRPIRALAILGTLSAVVVLLVGFTRISPDLVSTRAPVFAALLAIFGRS
jgi:hypothetical protein